VATITPKYAENYRWNSSNTSLATVDSTGKVKAIKAGTVYIYATTIDKSFKDSSIITIPSATGFVSWDDEKVSLFPVPVKDDLNLQFDATAEQTVVTITSAIGIELINETVSNNTGDVTVTIPVENLKRGLYFATIQYGDLKVTKKFIKQ
jgi:uncharacterized protein YjdB